MNIFIILKFHFSLFNIFHFFYYQMPFNNFCCCCWLLPIFNSNTTNKWKKWNLLYIIFLCFDWLLMNFYTVGNNIHTTNTHAPRGGDIFGILVWLVSQEPNDKKNKPKKGNSRKEDKHRLSVVWKQNRRKFCRTLYVDFPFAVLPSNWFLLWNSIFIYIDFRNKSDPTLYFEKYTQLRLFSKLQGVFVSNSILSH